MPACKKRVVTFMQASYINLKNNEVFLSLSIMGTLLQGLATLEKWEESKQQAGKAEKNGK